ncbi:putative oxidoreductase, aldo/keto reductase family protein isoform X1 [Zea mays]|uniref:Aldo-keto reductase family 4 member C9 n=1 Tax=Zea mays TaxID=4577 RepID=A0A1D6FNY7_MAIZE|nr:putative oxidoreductase, aldo/keto reductase family protein isoform X1 [Zea mays]AQK93348.1 Aldo-keto reductase family 4 member C9 [Zea mays]|eukprot:XP_008654449.1 putative oxidoreductase, aldo/keto reductase family protein isoform X1 [Zea mays]
MAESFVLSTGSRIPSVGLGVWQIQPDAANDAIYAAVKAGYRHIDCAAAYNNEEEIHGPIRIKKGTSTMTPENFLPTDIPATWAAMEKLYDSGKARAIGVSNFSCKKLHDLLAVARVPPAVNQVECHPVWQQDKLRKLCQSNGVHLSAFSPLGSPGSPWINGPSVLKNPIVVSVADKLQKTPAQVALRWGIQMGHSVLPKSANESRIKENIDIFGWSIPEDLMAKFSEIKQVRLLTAEFVVHPQAGYNTLEDFWDGEI